MQYSVYSTHPPTEGATPALKREHSETPLLTPRYMCTFYKGDPLQGAKGPRGARPHHIWNNKIRFASIVLDGVLEPSNLARHN